MDRPGILIVEDQGVLAKELAQKLESLGYVVVGRESTGTDAIERARETQPDVVLVDIELPGNIDGIEAAERIAQFTDTAIIYLTVHGDQAVFERARSTNPYAYLTKPLLPRELERTLELVLSRQAAERKLKDSERRYQELYEETKIQQQRSFSILESAAEAIVDYDLEGNVRYLNPAHTGLFGWSVDEVRNKRLPTVPQWDREATMQIIREIIRTGQPCAGYESQRLTKTGDVVDVSISASLYMDHQGEPAGMVVVLQDISERKQAEKALRESEELFRTLSEATFEAIFLSDRGICIGQNLTAEKMFGYTAEEALGVSGTEWLAPEYREQSVNAMLQGFDQPYESVALRKDGTTFPCEIQGKMVDYGGRLIRVTALRDITERKNWENRFKESESQYRRLFDSAPVGIISVDLDGNITEVNPKLLHILGSPSREATMNINMFDFSRLKEAGLTNVFRNCRDSGRPSVTELPYTSKWGKKTYLRLLLTPMKKETGEFCGCQAVVEDVTDRRQAEEALRANEQLLRTVLEGSPVGISLTRGRRLQWTNERFRKLFHFKSEQDCTGLDSRVLYASTADYYRVGALYERAGDGSIQEADIVWKRPDGSEFEGRLLLKAIDPDNPHDGAISSVYDITELKKAEELAGNAERLRAVGELASGVAHNFNNLLQIVLGSSQLALTDLELGNIDQARTNIQQIVDSAVFGAQTVKRLQDFARSRTDQVVRDGELFDLADTVDQAIEMSKPWWKTRPEKDGISITLNRYVRKECYVRGNENEIFEVIVNLIKNAAEALPDGGEIKIRTAVEDEHALAVVQDDGIGISPENQGRIFEPFWTTKGFQGTGMGLSSSYGIVQRHGGRIELRSRAGEGSRFTILLPLAAETAEETQPKKYPEIGVRLNILVTDDMPAVTKQLEIGLSSFDHTVLTASSGKEAIDIFNEAKVDAVICDLAMPDMNGRQVAEAILDICRTRGMTRPPFILLTGWGGQIDEEAAMRELGVDRIVEKPAETAYLLEIIADLVNRRISDRSVESPVTV